MGGRSAFIALLVLLVAVAGCVESDATFCADGSVCPRGLACAPAGGFCTAPGNIAACTGRGEGDSCSLVAGDIGRCSLGVCIDTSCGDGFEDDDEVCDDGNATSGDGCRADCQKVEVCGDAIADEGELCDDGNQNPADGCHLCVSTEWQAAELLRGGINATSEPLNMPFDMAVDNVGNVFIADTENHRIRRVDGASGIITLVGGTGIAGFSGDGGPASGAQLDEPKGVAVDGQGNVFIADFGNQRIRRIDATTGFITTVGGGGTGGDGGPATSASIAARSIFVDGLGNLFVASGALIRRIDGITGIITTPVTGLTDASDVVIDSQGNFFIAETLNSRIRRVDAVTGVLTILPLSIPDLSRPEGVAVDGAGNVFVASTLNERVWRIDAVTGAESIVAGSGLRGFDGDGGLATDARLHNPTAVAVDSLGNLFIADRFNDRIRRVDELTGIITTLAGSSSAIGDEAQATSVTAYLSHGLAVDGDGNLFVAESGEQVIYRVDALTGVISTVAGIAGNIGFDGDEPRSAVGALLKVPTGLAIDGDGNLFVADRNNNRIRKIDAVTGLITTFAGGGSMLGDNGPATAAQLRLPEAIAFDTAGNLFIADRTDNRIRRVDKLTGIITTYAGDGTQGFIDDTPRPATTARLDSPQGVAVDALGNVFIADTRNDRLRVVDAMTGDISTLVDFGPQENPVSVAVDGQGDLLVLFDRGLSRVDKLTGVMTTMTAVGCCGDGGPATEAGIDYPEDIVLDSSGNIFMSVDFRVRRIDAVSGVITTVLGAIDPPGTGPISAATLADPRSMCVGNDLTLFAGGSSGTVQVIRDGVLEVTAGRYVDSTATGDLARFRDKFFGEVGGVVVDAAAGVFYLSETTENRLQVVTMVDADDPSTWTIAPLAGASDGSLGYADGDALTALFSQPAGLYFDDASRILYVADRGNHVLRTIDVDSGIVGTVAGTPEVLGFGGDGGPAGQARLFLPEAVTACGNGDLFVADTGNNRIRRIEATTGLISTVLGDGVAASSGSGLPATGFPINRPAGLACDAFGNLFATSTQKVRMLAADDDGVIDGTGRVLTIYGLDQTKPPASLTHCLTGIAVIDDTTLHFTDSCTGFLIELTRQLAP